MNAVPADTRTQTGRPLRPGYTAACDFPLVDDLSEAVRLYDNRPSNYGGQADVYRGVWDQGSAAGKVDVRTDYQSSESAHSVILQGRREGSAYQRLVGRRHCEG